MNLRFVKVFVMVVIVLVVTRIGLMVFDTGTDDWSDSHEFTELSTLKVSHSPSSDIENIKLSIPRAHEITGGTQTFQTFNNCGPASLSMALSFYGISASQQELGNDLRPWQNSQGDNDDKSVTLSELSQKASEFGFTAYHQPAGDIETMKAFISQGIPVIARTLLELGSDIGHYRVLYGFNDATNEFTQNDSLQGQSLQYSYDTFLELWKPYGNEYLVLVPPEKIEVARQILGQNIDRDYAWKRAVAILESESKTYPEELYTKLSLSVAYYETGNYQKSVEIFEEIELRLPFRTLWYQIEPLLAYQKLGMYSKVLPRIESIFERDNRGFSELYQIRGEIYLSQGKVEAARDEFELALKYNAGYVPAQLALQGL